MGRLPFGITAKMLSGPHLSRPGNLLIADAFHRTGAVEVWGRGTNRVIEECKKYGIAPPKFEERDGCVIVTFRAKIGPGTKPGPSRDQGGTKTALSRHQVEVLAASTNPQSLQVLAKRCKRTNRTKFRDEVLRPLIETGLLELTVPDKPRSPKQRYRTTEAGWKAVKDF